MKYNILTDAFLYNSTPISGSLRSINPLEIDQLINPTGSTILSLSGSEISLVLDLGFQRSIEKLNYSFTTPSISGLLIKYGRTLENLTTASVNLTSSGIEILPTITGYSCPRYFTINHLASGINIYNIKGLQVFNTEEEVDFGSSGTLNSVSVVSPYDGGYSEVKEVPIYNDGTITTDLYASIDIANINMETLNNLQLSTSITGTFKSSNEDLQMPESIPWEWGVFSQTNISTTNTLKIDDPTVSFPTDVVGSSRRLLNPNNYYGNVPISITYSGIHYAVTTGNNNQFIFIDPQRNTIITKANPPTLPSTDNQRLHHGIAWDGNDRIYFIQNNTSREIKYFQLSTNTYHTLKVVAFYTRLYRQLAYYNGILYIGGAQDTAGTDVSIGTDFWTVDVNTLVETKVSSINPAGSNFCSLNGYIYYWYSTTSNFYRYKISDNSWETLSIGTVTSVHSLSANSITNLIYAGSGDDVYIFNTSSLSWSGPISTDIMTGGSWLSEAMCLCVENTMIYAYDYNGGAGAGQRAYVRPLITPPAPILRTTASGYWISPIFKIDQDNNEYHKIFLNYLTTSGANIKYDTSIGVDNFQIRGSNTSPSSDNDIENFDNLDTDFFIVGSLNQNTDLVVASGQILTFSHNFIDTTETLYNSAYITFGLPFETTGKMQYKFWWNPSSNKEDNNNNNFSAFYLVPFLNTIDTGEQPSRDINHLRRSEDNNIYLRFGQTSDDSGTFTAVQFYNGSTTTSYGINAVTGTFYEVCIIINWNIGSYSLYFDNNILGTGTIPQIRIQLLRNYHTYEIFSGGQNIDFEEKFKRLTINRIGTTTPEEISDIAIPVHREDPYYGTTGSLTWYPVTVNSAIIPKYNYIQLKLNLRTSTFYDFPEVKNILFPIVFKFSDIPPSGIGSLYLRYNFNPSNELRTDVINLKAWMKTDKE